MQKGWLKIGAVVICACVLACATGYAKDPESVSKYTDVQTITVEEREKAQDPVDIIGYVIQEVSEDIKSAPVWDLSQDEEYMLAKMAMAEAEGEDTDGKALVIMVILNRVESDDFPDTVEEVLAQKNAFTSYSNGRYGKIEPDEDCWEALRIVESGWDESDGATFFERDSAGSTWHKEHLRYLFRHGAHVFYGEKA